AHVVHEDARFLRIVATDGTESGCDALASLLRLVAGVGVAGHLRGEHGGAGKPGEQAGECLHNAVSMGRARGASRMKSSCAISSTAPRMDSSEVCSTVMTKGRSFLVVQGSWRTASRLI